MEGTMDRLARVCSHVSVEPSATAGGCPHAARPSTAPVRVCVTGAAGQIAYSLLPAIASGRMFGNDTPVILHLLDIPPMAKALVGVEMELRDCAFPLLQDLVVTVDPAAAFNQVDAAILVGAFPRRKGMLRKDLLEKNAAIFEQQGRVLNDYAKKSVKVLVVGNPANTNALICMHNAPDLPRENFTALTRLDLNRAKAQIARRVDTHINNVRNIIIWGNHSSTQYPDVSHAIIKNFPTVELTSPVRAAVNDERWVREEFIPTVQQRGAAIIKARQLSSAASAANAVVDHMHDWWLGTKRGSIVSMGVVSDGSYGVPRGLIYSFPVSCRNGQWSIVQNLRIDDFSRSKMDATAAELEQERDTAFSFLKAKQ